jgi:hypothetical protein
MINCSTCQHLINSYTSQENILEMIYMNRFRDNIPKVYFFFFIFCSFATLAQDPFHIPPVSLSIYPLRPTIPPANRCEGLKFRFYCVRNYFRFWDGNTIFYTCRVSPIHLRRCGNLLVGNSPLIIKKEWKFVYLLIYINKKARVVILANCCIYYIIYVKTMKIIPYIKQSKSQKASRYGKVLRVPGGRGSQPSR